MAINIKEILHPSDSDTIKFDKINYNFDQILINGGGPQGIQGQKGIQGADGATGIKGQKGEIGITGPVGPSGTTDTPWAKVAHSSLATHILKPKIDTDTVPAIIWLGDSTFNENTPADGYVDSISRITLARTVGIDHYASYFTSTDKILNFTGRAFDSAEFYGFKKDLGSVSNPIGFEVEVDKIILKSATGYAKITSFQDLELASNNGDVKINPNGILEVNAPGIINDYLNVNSTSHVKIATGTIAQRPAGVAGMIRFNSDDNRYEGHDGTKWSSLGGLIDADADTYIVAEKNADEDILRFNVGSALELTPGGGVEIATMGETITDGFENSIDVFSVKRVQENKSDIIFDNARGMITKASSATLSANQAQPANEGSIKTFRRLDDYYYQESTVLDSNPGTLTSTPFAYGTGQINPSNIKMTTKLLRLHGKTNGVQSTPAINVAIAYDNTTSKIAYVKTGHMVQCWGQLDFYQTAIDYTELEASGVITLDGKNSAGVSSSGTYNASRVAFYFAELGTFHYKNASDTWIYFPISMNMEAGANLENSPTPVFTHWGAIPPDANYFNILRIDGTGRNRFPADSTPEATGITDTAILEADFMNLLDINDGLSVTNGIPTLPTTLSWSFSMPTDDKSYDVISTLQSTYVEDGSATEVAVGNGPPRGDNGFVQQDAINLTGVDRPQAGTTRFTFTKTDDDCTAITVQHATSATGTFTTFTGTGTSCTSPFTITYSSAGTTKYFRLVQTRSVGDPLTSNVVSVTYPGNGGVPSGPSGPGVVLTPPPSPGGVDVVNNDDDIRDLG